MKKDEEFGIKRQVIMLGSSLAVTITSDLSRYLGIKKGDTVIVIPSTVNGQKVLLIK